MIEAKPICCTCNRRRKWWQNILGNFDVEWYHWNGKVYCEDCAPKKAILFMGFALTWGVKTYIHEKDERN